MENTFRWLWRLGAITTLIYVLVFATDCWVHFHQGWEEAARDREGLLQARMDCESGRVSSVILLERCAHVRATPLPVPWHRAVHHTGHHLAQKMTSALQCAVVLCLLGIFAFWFALRSQAPPPLCSGRQQQQQQHPAHGRGQGLAYALLDTVFKRATGSPAPEGEHPQPRPDNGPCVVELPEAAVRQRKPGVHK